MKVPVRVLLIDPLDDSRQVLQGLIEGCGPLWLAEASANYEGGAAVERAPDVVLINVDADVARAVSLMQEIMLARPGVAILPASRGRDSEVILRVVRAGAREFLTLPTTAEDLLNAITRIVPDETEASAAGRKGSQVIAVVGASGGIGTTSLAVNLAAELVDRSEMGVALLDFDLLLGAVDATLDVQTKHTLLEVAQDVGRLDLTLVKRSLVRHDSGVHILPRPTSLEDVEKIDPEALRKVVGMLKSTFSSVVIDTSKNLQASDFIAFELADVILVVVQMDVICLRNTARLLQLLRKFEGFAEKIKVVANRLGSTETEVSLVKAEAALGCPIALKVPNSFKIFNAARARGVTLKVEAPGSKVQRAIQEIARTVGPAPAETTAPVPKPRKFRFVAVF